MSETRIPKELQKVINDFDSDGYRLAHVWPELCVVMINDDTCECVEIDWPISGQVASSIEFSLTSFIPYEEEV